MSLSERRVRFLIVFGIFLLTFGSYAAQLIPPVERIKPDHPRVLLRPAATPLAVSVDQVRAAKDGEAGSQLLKQLRADNSASAQAMVWLLSGETAAADRAVAAMRAYRFPGEVDTFHVYFTLTQFALAYDWLHNYAGFTPQMKEEVRANVTPLAELGLRYADDHMFHNYIWMSAGGVALWGIATAGDDAKSDQLLDRVRERFNDRLFPAWKYLDGLPSEPMGYWTLYVFAPGALTILAVQSAYEMNLVEKIRQSDGAWLDRHYANLIHSTLPDMRYVPWGDLQSGPNGGVTSDVAGLVDALNWATRSEHGAYFREWLAAERGLKRYRADTALFHFLYGSRAAVNPAEPALSFMAGREHSGHFIARSGWDDGATILTLRSTDHFGDHHHYDQGSFMIYRNGLLAVDPPVYRKVAGPQQPTAVHNTLLIGGQGQRPARGQWFKTVEDFQRNLNAGRRLETGDMPFYKDAGPWAAAACQFAQAYWPTQVQSCVRQILFVRPDKIVVVDQLAAPTNGSLSDVQWLLQLPGSPQSDERTFQVSNGKSWLRCRPLLPDVAGRNIEKTTVNTERLSLLYQGGPSLKLVHLLEVGDTQTAAQSTAARATVSDRGVEVKLAGKTYTFSDRPPYAVTD